MLGEIKASRRHQVQVTDETGIIYFSNRSELVYRDRTLGADVIQSEDETIAPFFAYSARQVLGLDLWNASAGRWRLSWTKGRRRRLRMVPGRVWAQF